MNKKIPAKYISAFLAFQKEKNSWTLIELGSFLDVSGPMACHYINRPNKVDKHRPNLQQTMLRTTADKITTKFGITTEELVAHSQDGVLYDQNLEVDGEDNVVAIRRLEQAL